MDDDEYEILRNVEMSEMRRLCNRYCLLLVAIVVAVVVVVVYHMPLLQLPLVIHQLVDDDDAPSEIRLMTLVSYSISSSYHHPIQVQG